MINFRKNDILNNGQGAPLSPIYHKSIIEDLLMPLPACFINIGGISNLTYWDGINLFGFDTGPGNCLLDEIVKKYTNEEFDNNGELSLAGKVNYKEVKKFLDDNFFKLAIPKSLDKLYFKKHLLVRGYPKHFILRSLANLSYSQRAELIRDKNTNQTNTDTVPPPPPGRQD